MTRATSVEDLPAEQIRLLTKVARMYHERGMRQPQIAEQLHISQPRVSRLLKRAVEVGIVRTTVITPRGVHSDLEERIEQAYGLTEVVVADTDEQADEQQVLRALGSAAAVYLETTLMGSERIGVSSWSSTLLATVDAMHPRPTPVAEKVVQILGGVGNVTAQTQATRITGGLAKLTGATAVYLPAPGLLASGDMREMFNTDPNIQSVLRACDDLTMALVGIGSVEPSPLLRESGNAFDENELPALRDAGAVGDVCMRFFDEQGRHIPSGLDERVLGIGADRLRAVPRRVGVAGGARKFRAIRAAVRGGWVSVLITDLQVARRLAAPEALATL
jgi:DNA-binding transcriptional regulator LsrR (DeoR family)